MHVEFRVLGPLEIRRAGAPLPLRASKQRLFLADLLVHRQEVVSVDRLVEDVWPVSPPAGARHALEAHATRLRNLLGDDVPLLARPPGYILDVDPQSIDSVRFEQLLEEARDALGSDPARASVRASDALALWRGDAYADFAFESFALEEIARLEELRKEAEEERIDAELAVGRSDELIGELEALVVAAPLRERRRGQLMLALYRAGRQADALEAFRDARELLVEELGLEPSEELRELERRILLQDTRLLSEAAPRTESRVERRLVTVVAVEPEISLELDPEEHDRQTRRAADAVAGVAGEYGAEQRERFLLVFSQEDHTERATAAAAAVRETLRARVGLASGEALIGGRSLGGAVVSRAWKHAHGGGMPEAPPAIMARRIDGPFVGREDELARLRGARAALVVGPPGIGKSRLALELARDAFTAVGRCSSYGAASLAPLHEIAAALGRPNAIADAWALEVPLRFRRLCEDAAPQILVVFDDVHWADQLVVDTIEHLVAHGKESVRVLCLAREELLEERPAFVASADRLILEPLAPEHAQLLAAQLADVDGGVLERALDAAEGNPLFLEQLLAHAAEDGATSLPPNLKSLLAARLDRLPPSERAAMEHAGIIGREFDASRVAQLMDARAVRRPLTGLVRRGLLDPTASTSRFEERFRFRHVLIREATYAATPAAERSRLHERLADLIDADDELVGFHLERAAALRLTQDRHTRQLAHDAGRHLGAAGIAAWQREHAAAAVDLLGRAAALLPPESEQRSELLCELAIALNTLGRGAEARAVLEEAVTQGDRRIVLRARMEHAAIAVLEDSEQAAYLLELAETGLPVFETVGDERSLGRAFMLAGWVRGGAQARHAEWQRAAEQALDHYRRAGWPAATCIGHIAAALYFGPTPVPAAIARCCTLLDEHAVDLAGRAHVSAYLGGLHAMAGEYEEAASLLDWVRSTYLELDRTRSLMLTCAPIEGRVAWLEGDCEAAIAIWQGNCEALLAADAGFHLATQGGDLADLLCRLGRKTDAERWCAIAERFTRPDDIQGQVCTRLPRSRLLMLDQQPEEAMSLATEAVAIANQTDETNLIAAAHLVLAGTLSGADAAVERAAALAAYDAKGNVAAAIREAGNAAATSRTSA
jgi:DNA-binding SARP family transcriptional activator/DNA polymerase III delta prime subunit